MKSQHGGTPINQSGRSRSGVPITPQAHSNLGPPVERLEQVGTLNTGYLLSFCSISVGEPSPTKGSKGTTGGPRNYLHRSKLGIANLELQRDPSIWLRPLEKLKILPVVKSIPFKTNRRDKSEKQMEGSLLRSQGSSKPNLRGPNPLNVVCVCVFARECVRTCTHVSLSVREFAFQLGCKGNQKEKPPVQVGYI